MSYRDLFKPFKRSGCRAHHSTVTTLVKIANDLLEPADSGHFSPADPLDSAGSLCSLSIDLRLTGSVLFWLHSYLSDRQQFVSINSSSSHLSLANHGVPQVLVLGPTIFTTYSRWSRLVRSPSTVVYTQLYLSTTLTSLLHPQSIVCLQEINIWASPIFPSFKVHSLGVILDSTLYYQSDIKYATKPAFFHQNYLRTFSRTRRFWDHDPDLDFLPPGLLYPCLI